MEQANTDTSEHGLRPLGSQVLVRQDKVSDKVGREKLLFAPQGSEQWNSEGVIVAVGPKFYDGYPEDECPRVGDRILFMRNFKKLPGGPRVPRALNPDTREGVVEEWRDLVVIDQELVVAVLG